MAAPRKEEMTEQTKPTMGTVPVPNILFDEMLPQLSDAELRVLLVVMRSTLGWREGSDFGGTRFKRRDWITHRQLMKRTGRGSAGVSAAIQSLIAKSLIVVENEAGLPLVTAEERRRNMGRLYFRPVDKWITARLAVIGRAASTTYNKNNIKKHGIAASGNVHRANRHGSGLQQVSAIISETRLR